LGREFETTSLWKALILRSSVSIPGISLHIHVQILIAVAGECKLSKVFKARIGGHIRIEVAMGERGGRGLFSVNKNRCFQGRDGTEEVQEEKREEKDGSHSCFTQEEY